MATKALVKVSEPPNADIIEKVMMHGDLSELTADQRFDYYKSVCETLGLNPLTKPFDYITLDGKLVLYARKDCTEQLRKRYGISLKITHREHQDSIYVVTAQATLPGGRVDESIGAVSTVYKDGEQVKGTVMANAVMKAETKAKRRVTLSICGLGMLDESELDTVSYDQYDQRPPNEIVERNVREATANAAGSKTAFLVGEVTQDNYKHVLCHVGKAQGNMLGKLVGELPREVVEWMYNKWRDRLGPTASADDMRLKKAIEFAYKDLKAVPPNNGGGAGGAAGSIPGGAQTAAPVQLKTQDGKTVVMTRGDSDILVDRSKLMVELKNKITDLVLTPRQFCGYLTLAGFSTVGQIEELDDGQLQYLVSNWQTTKEIVSNLARQPVPGSEPPPKKDQRKGKARK